jgi:Flp pilus assembly protein TadD
MSLGPQRFSATLLAIALASGAVRAQDSAQGSTSGEPSSSDKDLGQDTASEVGNMVGEALRKLAQERNRDGLSFLQAKDYPKALERFQQAYELSPQDAEIANNLGYIYQLLGNNAEAEVHFRAALTVDPSRLVTYLNLADLIGVKGESMERLAEAAELLGQARELKGNKTRIIIRQARIAALRGDFATAERFYLELGTAKGTSAKTFLEIGDFYRDFGHAESALHWYRLVEDEDLGKIAAARLFELEAEREARKLGWNQGVEVVGSQARKLATRGRLAANQGNLEEAERLLAESLALAPTFGAARADLGDLFRRTNRLVEAEMSYLRALASEPNAPEISARLGELYASQGRGAEAAQLLSRALEARPDWHALNLKLAKALQSAGDLRGALARVDRYLAISAQGEQQSEALVLKASISKLLPGTRGRTGIAESLANIERTRTMDPAIANALAKVRLHLSEDRPDAAMAQLRSLPKSKRDKDVLNLEGRILMSGVRMDEAASILLESLSLDPDQSEVHEQLGAIYEGQSKRELAIDHYGRAESLGSLAASFHLARLAFPKDAENAGAWLRDMVRLGGLFTARARVRAFLDSGSSSLYSSDARSLDTQLSQRLHAALGAWMGTIVALLLLGAFIAWRLVGGSTLGELANRHPESGPEVQRVMAAIRHEVLKHNTVMLDGLADAVERRDPEIPDKAAHLYSVLWGKGDANDGVAARLENYAKELIRIGRARGVRLNLTRKDPALSALRQGFGVLARSKSLLEHAGRLGPNGRAKLLRALRRSFELLNVRGYGAVSALLNELKVLSVDLPTLKAIVERVRSEPALLSQDIAPALIESLAPLPQGVLMARRDFEDIVANLVRNALQSSLAEAERPAQIGVSLDLQRNEITGIETLEIAVHDRCKEALTTEMIRGRYIERGLGLTADLVSRYEGSIDVVPGPPGWSKSVRVQLPLAGEEDSAEAGA